MAVGHGGIGYREVDLYPTFRYCRLLMEYLSSKLKNNLEENLEKPYFCPEICISSIN